MNRQRNRAAALIAAGLISLSVGVLSAGQAQAVGQSPGSSASVSVQEVSDFNYYTAIETRFVYSSPDLTSRPVAQILAGEVVSAGTDVITNRFGQEFRYAWTFNYRTGHFFSGYVEADNLRHFTQD
ncbi:hypothetical protein [Streptomyces sp. NPDC001774]